MGKDGLAITDARYGTENNHIYAQEQMADAILSITPETFCLYDADDNKIPLVQSPFCCFGDINNKLQASPANLLYFFIGFWI